MTEAFATFLDGRVVIKFIHITGGEGSERDVYKIYVDGEGKNEYRHSNKALDDAKYIALRIVREERDSENCPHATAGTTCFKDRVIGKDCARIAECPIGRGEK